MQAVYFIIYFCIYREMTCTTGIRRILGNSEWSDWLVRGPEGTDKIGEKEVCERDNDEHDEYGKRCENFVSCPPESIHHKRDSQKPNG